MDQSWVTGREDRPVPSLRDQLGALWRGLPIVVACAVLALAAAAGWLMTRERVYRAEMKIVVGYGATVGLPDVRDGAEVLTQTLSELIESEIVAARVIQATDADLTSQELLSSLEVTSSPSAAVLDVAYDDVDPARAREVLSQVGFEFRRLVNGVPDVIGPVAGVSTSPAAVIFDPAHTLPDPVSPRPFLTLVVAGLGGTAIGIGLVLARESVRRDRALRERRRLELDGNGSRQRDRQAEPHPERARRLR